MSPGNHNAAGQSSVASSSSSQSESTLERDSGENLL